MDWGWPVAGRWRGGDPEHAVSQLLRRADPLAATDPGTAAGLQQQALDLIRELKAAAPDDPVHNQMLGSVGYQLGASLTAADRPGEAVEALAGAERAYLELPATFAQRDAWVADVRARRAVALAGHGKGVSAVGDAQTAVETWRRLVAGGADVLDLARTLALAADALAVFGDPDLAVAAADYAIREYLHNAARINASRSQGAHAPYLVRACLVAIMVHGANGRREPASGAEEILRGTLSGRLPATITPQDLMAVVPTALGSRIREGKAPDLTLTLAAALRRAAPGDPGPRLLRELTRPAVDVALLMPCDRTSAATAHVAGLELAGLAQRVADNNPDVAVRIGVEAHHLFAWASEQQTLAMRYELGTVGPPWARSLLLCARLAERRGDLVLAEDLASWAGGVATQLMPFALIDPQARTAARDSLQAHGALLQRLGEHDRAADALAAARTLGDLP